MSTARTEDAALVAAIVKAANLTPTQAAKLAFDRHCLVANGVESIHAAEPFQLAGKTCLLVTVRFRQGYLGNGGISRGRIETGYLVVQPKGWTRQVLNAYWIHSHVLHGWVRKWGPAGGCGIERTREKAMGRMEDPEARWTKWTRSGIQWPPMLVRKKKPEGREKLGRIWV